jgi:hypothetical protein
MPGGKTKDQTLAEAEKIIRVWQANADLSMGETDLAKFQGAVGDLRQAGTKVDETRTLLTGQINEANDKRLIVTKLITRIRSVVRGTYGPDSSQYEQVGGTRASERKPAKRKTTPTP